MYNLNESVINLTIDLNSMKLNVYQEAVLDKIKNGVEELNKR